MSEINPPPFKIRLLWPGGSPEDWVVSRLSPRMTVEDRRHDGSLVAFEASDRIDIDGSVVFKQVKSSVQ